MTVRELIERLSIANPDMPVLADCENRGDPHPISSLAVLPTVETEDVTYVAHVLLVPDTAVDFEVRIWKEYEEDEE